ALAERRRGAAADAAAFDAFADETAARFAASIPRTWQSTADRIVESSIGAFPRRALTHLEWRRWRRYGI
ncbi:MAG TPA: hypothetical protein VJU58_02740, partial [Microbacterium sp.]|nr:hypothetical protein [Microbacterium sp.]